MSPLRHVQYRLFFYFIFFLYCIVRINHKNEIILFYWSDFDRRTILGGHNRKFSAQGIQLYQFKENTK